MQDNGIEASLETSALRYRNPGGTDLVTGVWFYGPAVPLKFSSKKTRLSQLRRLAGRQLLFQTCPYEAPGLHAENRPSGFFLHVGVELHHRALVVEGGWNYRHSGEAGNSLELEL